MCIYIYIYIHIHNMLLQILYICIYIYIYRRHGRDRAARGGAGSAEACGGVRAPGGGAYIYNVYLIV